MEWLLVLMMNLPPEKVDIGDATFPTKQECLAAGSELLKRGSFRVKPKAGNGGGEGKVIRLKPINPVVRYQVDCIAVTK